jgi:hypothetical protein
VPALELSKEEVTPRITPVYPQVASRHFAAGSISQQLHQNGRSSAALFV